MRFRSKPVEIEAYQYVGGVGVDRWPDWLRSALVDKPANQLRTGEVALSGPTLHIGTPEGITYAEFGYWIIRGTEGELYPCKPSVFERKYEPA